MYSAALSTLAIAVALHALWLAEPHWKQPVDGALAEEQRGAEASFVCSTSFACPDCRPEVVHVNTCAGHSWSGSLTIWLLGVWTLPLLRCIGGFTQLLRAAVSQGLTVSPDSVGDLRAPERPQAEAAAQIGPITASQRRALTGQHGSA